MNIIEQIKLMTARYTNRFLSTNSNPWLKCVQAGSEWKVKKT